MRFKNDHNKNVSVALFLDDIPDTQERFDRFKTHIDSLSAYPLFAKARVHIAYADISSVNSKDHVILQGLDIILGAMQFKLNHKDKEKPEGSHFRGKRTIAKDAVYKHISHKIREIYPGFNVGSSTGQHGGPTDKWSQPYWHWLFIPADHRVDFSKGKKNRPR
jgi:hypothetical protein